MPTPPLPVEIRRKALELRQEGKTYAAIAKELDISQGAAYSCVNSHTPLSKETADDPDWYESGESATWSGITQTPIKTLEDACKAAGVDESVWYVDRWECSQWTVGMMPKGAEKPVQTQQYRVNAADGFV